MRSSGVGRAVPNPPGRFGTRRAAFARMAFVTMIAGAGPARAADDPSRDLVVMKQFLVEATRLDKHPWLYVSFADREFLSRCDGSSTRQMSDIIEDVIAIEKEIVPQAYLPPLAVPVSIIMFNYEPPKVVAALVPGPIRDIPPPNFGPLTQYLQWTGGATGAADADTSCSVANHWGYYGEPRGLGRGLGLLAHLRQCAPALPPWFVCALMGPDSMNRYIPFRAKDGPGLILPAASWTSQAEADRLIAEAKKSNTLPKLPPIEELFRLGGPGGANSSAARPAPILMAEAALFMRWCLFSGSARSHVHVGGATPFINGQGSLTVPERRGPARDAGERADGALRDAEGNAGFDVRSAFAKFVERSRTEPVTEALFRECFGFGFAEMQTRLSRYLVEAVRGPIEFGFQQNDQWPPFYTHSGVRKATSDEIGRILGDWLRMKGDLLRAGNPELGSQYLHAAGQILERAYREDNGLPPDADPAAPAGQPARTDRNASYGPATVMPPVIVKADRIHEPKLLAVYGMYAYDTGDLAKAREFLQAAANTGVVRPAAYIDLAQLNFNEAQAHPASAGRRFSAQQTSAVLTPLFTSQRQATLTAEGYGLIAQAWSRAVAKPSPANLAVLDQGISLYPFDAALNLSVARVYAQWGYAAEAQALVERGAKFGNDKIATELLDLKTPPGDLR